MVSTQNDGKSDSHVARAMDGDTKDFLVGGVNSSSVGVLVSMNFGMDAGNSGSVMFENEVRSVLRRSIPIW